MTIDFRSREPAYRQLAAILRSQIADGTYRKDDTLPPVRQLASDHGLAVETVRNAVRLLEDEGLVVAVPGRATYVL